MTRPSHGDRLRTLDLTLAYGDLTVVRNLTVSIPDGKVTVIVGPNACGKSTLLKAIGRILAPRSGSIVLDGESIQGLPTKQVAKRLGLLPQSSSTPEGMTVEDLVARGRFPHQGMFRQWTATDEAAVEQALVLTETRELRHRPVDELSGGQRQRVWVAMTLSQDTPILLLDEPTTHLDIAHQLELLDLMSGLNLTQNRTIVMVLHDLNHAARYAHHLVAMSDGSIVAEGPPGEVVTPDIVGVVFGIESMVVADPVTGTPMVVPVGAAGRRREAVSE